MKVSAILLVFCLLDVKISGAFTSVGCHNSNMKRSHRFALRSASTSSTSPSKSKKRKRKTSRQKRHTHSPPKSNTNNSRKSKKKQYHIIRSDEELNAMSIGQAIQESITTDQLLNTASRLWIPTDDDLPSHLRSQSIHHEKRIRWSSQLLNKLGYSFTTVQFNPTIWEDKRLARAVLACAMPFDGTNGKIDKEKVKQSLLLSLSGLHSLAGYTLPVFRARPPGDTSRSNQIINHHSSSSLDVHQDIIRGFKILLERSESFGLLEFTLREAVEARWSILGLLSRINMSAELQQSDEKSSSELLRLPMLNKRVAELPFDIIPSCLEWSKLIEDNKRIDGTTSQDCDDDDIIFETLLRQIPFKIDEITTRSGSIVEERRATAWIAESNIGALAYSGKLMAPSSIPPIVQKAMRSVEEGILRITETSRQQDDLEQMKLCIEEPPGVYFDCALCNHYPNSESACKFHTDPEHGTYWEQLTCVVSAGNSDVRKFAFRPIPKENTWSRWNLVHDKDDDGEEYKWTDKHQATESSNKDEEEILPAVTMLFPGDVVMMYGACNDVFHHAVYGRHQTGGLDGVNVDNGRISIVLKKAKDRGGGRKGHGKRGEGRRSRNRSSL